MVRSEEFSSLHFASVAVALASPEIEMKSCVRLRISKKEQFCLQPKIVFHFICNEF
jgi:hypothetical protein